MAVVVIIDEVKDAEALELDNMNKLHRDYGHLGHLSNMDSANSNLDILFQTQQQQHC